MIVSPSLPAVAPRQEAGPLSSVLAVVGGDRSSDAEVLRWACSLADEHVARLTVLCLWSMPPMWPWVALSGAGAAVQMLELHRRELISWLQAELEQLGTQPARVLRSRCCDAPARVVASELSRDAYSCVVGSRRTLGRRAAARLRRSRPELTLVRL